MGRVKHGNPGIGATKSVVDFMGKVKHGNPGIGATKSLD